MARAATGSERSGDGRDRKRDQQGSEGTYTAKDITVLKGLEGVRMRPAMYIGSTGPRGHNHLLIEVMDNAVDEALAGHCDEMTVTLLRDGGARITDNGRGIPVDMHPEVGKPALEVVLTHLHAGGKFGGKSYAVSGGLHGVGVSVVNALTRTLIAEVRQKGRLYRQEFSRGEPVGDVEEVGPAEGSTGTTITFWPDEEIFGEQGFRYDTVAQRVREISYLAKGLRITLTDEREESPRVEEFYAPGGVADFVAHMNEGKDVVNAKAIHFEETRDDRRVDVALQWNSTYMESVLSFVNTINTHEGGTHDEGFKRALTRALNDYARKKGQLKDKDEGFAGEDTREGLTAIVSLFWPEPQFEGQTKTKLGNTEARSVVEEIVRHRLAEWLEENPGPAKAIVAKAMGAQKARLAARQARELARKKGALGPSALAGRLWDCTNRDPAAAEIFIVEGVSAGGSAKSARDRSFQAILPLKGKILNVEKSRLVRALENEQIIACLQAIGAGIGDECDPAKSRYHKIVILSDADIDGHHIRTLLLTLFYRQMSPLIEAGYVYIGQPPLYKIRHDRQAQYAYSDEELYEKTKRLKKVDVQRYKGLGEMEPEELWETTMDPATRMLLQVEVEDAAAADLMFSTLMGEPVEPRRKYITSHAKDVRFLDV